ncbi:MAG: hypothetical protein QOF78_4545 [Phycisphaerales bacterium]|jgi:hypothetical protein|nr:hypothetical protein [Phycisphaerales bacterium]MEA2735374.1 hypothetical protein [Humisphaera sp.]
MLFMVRGKDRDQDRCLRVHAESAEEAEAIGWKRGLFVTAIEPIEKGSMHMARLHQVLQWLAKTWRATPANSLKCFGQPVSKGQSSLLLLLGCATWVVNLRMFGFVHI